VALTSFHFFAKKGKFWEEEKLVNQHLIADIIINISVSQFDNVFGQYQAWGNETGG